MQRGLLMPALLVPHACAAPQVPFPTTGYGTGTHVWLCGRWARVPGEALCFPLSPIVCPDCVTPHASYHLYHIMRCHTCPHNAPTCPPHCLRVPSFSHFSVHPCMYPAVLPWLSSCAFPHVQPCTHVSHHNLMSVPLHKHTQCAPSTLSPHVPLHLHECPCVPCMCLTPFTCPTKIPECPQWSQMHVPPHLYICSPHLLFSTSSLCIPHGPSLLSHLLLPLGPWRLLTP